MYTLFDTLIDLYVTIVIAYILVKHILRLRRTRTEGKVSVYISIIAQNVVRTIILTLSNLTSAVLIIMVNWVF